MNRGAWQAAVLGHTELDTTEASWHRLVAYFRTWALDGSFLPSSSQKFSLYSPNPEHWPPRLQSSRHLYSAVPSYYADWGCPQARS